MIGLWVLNSIRPWSILKHTTRWYGNEAPSKIRNIGIIAHIDAGKTTTTESILYHSGKIKRMGRVDSGSTVTDFLPSERARGITVQSAAVSFKWGDHFINLIDTPGHVDFTIEVERALHVLDGVVAVLDGSRGVEAQTRKVWRQADDLKIPKIAFVNKMDKKGSDFAATVRSMQQSLNAKTFILQYPITNNGFNGIVNVLNLTVMRWNSINDPESACVSKLQATDEDFNVCVMLKRKLIEQLSDYDDDLAEMYLSQYSRDVSEFPEDILMKSLAKAVKEFDAVPIFCGSAVNDIGITALLNAIVQYLPSPEESNTVLSVAHKNDFLGYSFKVVHHKRYGPVVFVRVLSGALSANSKIYNASKDCDEWARHLYTVFADEYKQTPVITEGNIAAVTGLKITGTGDTIYGVKAKENKLLDPVAIPQPVFFCTVEADSPTEVNALEASLAITTREDPSIQVKRDSDSGQTILCGMGELHMEVLIERLKKEFKLNCYIGPIQVAYREKVLRRLKKRMEYHRTFFDKTHDFEMEISVRPSSTNGVSVTVNDLKLSPELLFTIREGILQACHSGPLIGFPLMGTRVEVHHFQMKLNSPLTVVAAAVVNMTSELLQQANCGILEPLMNIEIVTTAAKLSEVLKILAQKHAKIFEIKGDEVEKCVSACAPVAEMLGFASAVRTISSGNADLTLHVAGYEEICEEGIESLRNRMIGKDLR